MEANIRQSTVENILVTIPEYIRKVKCDTTSETLPFKCAVLSCTNAFLSFEERENYPYKFHNFPLDGTLCQLWKKQCALPQHIDVTKLKVCSDHFELDDYIRNYKAEFSNPNFKRQLHPNAIPKKNINTDIKAETSNENLSFRDIKQAVDENEILKKKMEALLRRKSKLMHKINAYDKKITVKSKELLMSNVALKQNLRKQRCELKTRKNVVRKVFSNAQVNLLLGKKRVFWSEDDLAKAFTLRHIGNKECYLYLKNTLNMPLPALACVQKWAASCNTS